MDHYTENYVTYSFRTLRNYLHWFAVRVNGSSNASGEIYYIWTFFFPSSLFFLFFFFWTIYWKEAFVFPFLVLNSWMSSGEYNHSFISIAFSQYHVIMWVECKEHFPRFESLRDWSKSIGGGGWAGAERGWVISFWTLGKGWVVQFLATRRGWVILFLLWELTHIWHNLEQR